MNIKGVNLGNWLVLEKWMNPALFEGTTAEDEYYLPTQLSPEVYEARIKIHRSEYITERDFVTIKEWEWILSVFRYHILYLGTESHLSAALKNWIKHLTGRKSTDLPF